MDRKPQTFAERQGSVAQRNEIIVRKYESTTPRMTASDLAAWIVAQGLMTHCTTQNASYILRKAGLEPAMERAKARTPSAAYCPWVVRVEHANDPVFRALSAYAKERTRPGSMTERDRNRLEPFKAEMDRLNAIVCHYDPYDAKGRFFWLRTRRPGEEGKYVVGPDGIAR